MSDQLVPVRRALLSVSDKTGLKEFASALVHEFHVDLISTGGTAQFLRDAGLPVTDVSAVTGFPEMMDGRIKTLHPLIHGGLLALRDNPEHAAAMAKHNICPIDLVCVNLYPFAKTIAKSGATFEEAIENIDIGGPAMIRSAAKNHRFVLVVTEPDRYEKVLGDLRKHSGSSCSEHRLKQAQRAFAQTSEYDAAIANYLKEEIEKSPNETKWSTGSGPARFISSTPIVATAVATKEPPSAPSQDTGSKLVQRLLEGNQPVHNFLNDLITAQALAVYGTEAVAFLVSDDKNGQTDLQLVAHLRPDGAEQDIRDQAITAFLRLIKSCLEVHRDAAVVTGYTDKDTLQFCLVTFLRKSGKIHGASAVIARFPDIDKANRGLLMTQLIAGYFEKFELMDGNTSSQEVPATLDLRLKKYQDLRYGENPHQKAAIYINWQLATGNLPLPNQLHGKELSYINLLDADAALAAVQELTAPAACIVKHATPCGYATAVDLATAFVNAYAGDPLAAFGGIVALNRNVDLKTAQAIVAGEKFLEVIIAPGYDAEALELLKSRWKNVRLLQLPTPSPGNPGEGGGEGPSAFSPDSYRDSAFSGSSPHPNPLPDYQARGQELQIHSIAGGYLVQQPDTLGADESAWKIASKRHPTEKEMADLKIAWLACKHVKSNAIVIAKDQMMLGSGAGQQDRVSACRLAVAKAGERAKGAVAASDAFFPFPDGPALLLEAGITAIIHPGGSVRDHETLKLIDEKNAAMILTGQRHFKH